MVNKLASSELQELGVLSNCPVNVVQMEESVEYPNYSERTYTTSDKDRMKYISGLIENIRKSGNTLVLVDRIKAGNLLFRKYSRC